MRADAQGCHLLVPAEMGSGGSLRWIGTCRNGLAEGPGVIRVQVEASDVRLFAGVMRAGQPVAGFLDMGPNFNFDSGGPALHFKGADALPVANPAQVQQACNIAAQGAHAASALLRAANNPASASFYEQWVTSLKHCNEPE